MHPVGFTYVLAETGKSITRGTSFFSIQTELYTGKFPAQTLGFHHSWLKEQDEPRSTLWLFLVHPTQAFSSRAEPSEPAG